MEEKIYTYLEKAQTAEKLNKYNKVYYYALKVLELDPRNTEAWNMRFWNTPPEQSMDIRSMEMSRCLEKLVELGKTDKELEAHFTAILDFAVYYCQTAKEIENRAEFECRFTQALCMRQAVPNEAIAKDEITALLTEKLACAYVLMIADYMARFYPDGRIPETMALEWKKNLARINEGLPPEQITSANDPDLVFSIESPSVETAKDCRSGIQHPVQDSHSNKSYQQGEGRYSKKESLGDLMGGNKQMKTLHFLFLLVILWIVYLMCI